MTIAQAERFYENDVKKYDVAKNRELLMWLKEAIKNGYHSFIDIEELQEFIDNIVYWYEIKYPEREMELSEGTHYFEFDDMKSLSKKLNIRQLMYRLPHNQLELMKCNYRSRGGVIRDIYNTSGEIVGHKIVTCMAISKKNHNNDVHEGEYYLLSALSDSGIVDIDYVLKKYINEDNITLDELLVIFREKYADILDFAELEECVYDHNCDIELRRRVLQLVALKLLYSKNSIPERGYERAKRFINEFNKKLGLTLTTKEVDLLMVDGYSNNERYVHVLKSYIDDDGEKHLYWCVEDQGKQRNNSFIKVSRRLKSLFKK